jgi:ADP-ribose pyrophosphatase YjhB (NUDIX family)
MNRISAIKRRSTFEVAVRLLAWAMKQKFTAGASVCVFAQNNILLVHSRHRRKGVWGLPAGFCNRNELPEVTAARELAEETGLREFAGLTHVKDFRHSHQSHYESVFRLDLEVVDLNHRPSVHAGFETADVRWFPIDRLPILLPEASAAIEFALR